MIYKPVSQAAITSCTIFYFQFRLRRFQKNFIACLSRFNPSSPFFFSLLCVSIFHLWCSSVLSFFSSSCPVSQSLPCSLVDICAPSASAVLSDVHFLFPAFQTTLRFLRRDVSRSSLHHHRCLERQPEHDSFQRS